MLKSAPDRSDATPVAAGGRPRRYKHSDELELLFAAAMKVMERNEFQDMTVADVLDVAGVSTRSFYRHFASKDDLLCALYRRDGEKARDHLESRISSAPDPRVALEVWIDEILGFTYEKRRAHRVAVLTSPGALKAQGVDLERRRTVNLLTVSLVSVLEAGRQDGTFPLADPKSDAASIATLAFDAAGLNAKPLKKQTRAQARDAVLAFTLRALGGQ
ncbi:MAG: TetR/AcrR family transcriptional regulator [Acidobacteriota bacterium]|nr:TetR/AcrR family transcriptional regulator [Acidobacteriota bacterium]